MTQREMLEVLESELRSVEKGNFADCQEVLAARAAFDRGMYSLAASWLRGYFDRCSVMMAEIYNGVGEVQA